MNRSFCENAGAAETRVVKETKQPKIIVFVACSVSHSCRKVSLRKEALGNWQLAIGKS